MNVRLVTPSRRLGVPPSARPLSVLLSCLTASLVTLCSPPAGAAQRTWINALGGTAGNAANWNPAGTPAFNDSLTFDLAATYTTTFGFNVPTTHRIYADAGTVSFILGVPHTHYGPLFIGTAPGGTALLDFISGDFHASDPVVVGSSPGANGTMRVTGSAANVYLSGTSALFAVGSTDGVGTLLVRDGGLLENTSHIEVGTGNAAAVGTLRVVGEALTPVSRRSTFSAQAHYSDEMRVGYSGTGAVEVREGGLLDVQRTLVLGGPGGSTGSLLVTGVGLLDSARATVSGDLWIGRDDDGVAGGTGSVEVEAGGVVEVAGATYTFDDASGPGGTITTYEGGRFATGSLYLEDPAAELVLNGGKLQVIGGLLDTNAEPLSIGGGGGTPVVELLDGATCAIGYVGLQGLELGTTGPGRMNVKSGSLLVSNLSGIALGAVPGRTGTLFVDDATVSTNKRLAVGSQGDGNFIARGGATVTAFDLDLATVAGTSATVTVADPGTNVNVTNFLHASGTSSAGSGSPSTIVVSNGGHLNLNRAGVCGTAWPGNELQVNGTGVLAMAGTLNVKGAVSFAGGSSDGGAFSLEPGAVLSGSGEVLSSVTSLTDTTMEVVLTGPMTLGRADRADGFNLNGSLIINGYTATLLDADTARVGSIWLAGGRLVGPPAGLSLQGRVLGSGTIEGGARNRTTIVADASPGLSFAGMLESYGRSVSGTLRFLAGGGFLGRGTLAGSVHVDSGAVMTNDGVLTVGNVSAPGVVDIEGTVHAGPSNVAFYPSDTTRVGGTITLHGGLILSLPASEMRIRHGGLLNGAGSSTIKTIVDGTLAPGDPLGQRFGTLTMSALVMRATGTLELELGSIASGETDKIAGVGQADLAGTLEIRRVSLVANPGDSVQVLAYTSRSGTFANVTLDGGPTAGVLEVHYNVDGVWIVFPSGLLDVPGGPGGNAAPRALAFSALGSPGAAPRLELALPLASEVRVELFDLGGRRLAIVEDAVLPPGWHRLARGLEEMPSGELCFARARIANASGVTTRVTRLVRIR